MSEEQEVDRSTPQTDELKSLKARANTIGLKFHPNIGLDKLRDKVNAQLNKDSTQLKKEALEAKKAPVLDDEAQPIPVSTYDYSKPVLKQETPAMRKARMRKKAVRLIRYKLTCMNENKKKWKGEIITVMNSTVGTISRFIPFNAESWHCEEMLLNMIRERKYSSYIEIKGKKGRPVKKVRLMPEFAIEILPPLTSKELEDLRIQQAMAGTVGSDD